MKTVIDATGDRTVTGFERLLKLFTERPKVADVLRSDMFHRPADQLCFKQQPQIQDLSRRGCVERHNPSATVWTRAEMEQVAAPDTLYREPETPFVAGFIGSPAMNLLPAALLQPGNPDMLLGVRPEDMAMATDAALLQARVVAVEYLGAESLVICEVGPERGQATTGQPLDPSGASGPHRLVLRTGWLVWVVAEGLFLVWTGSAWEVVGEPQDVMFRVLGDITPELLRLPPNSSSK